MVEERFSSGKSVIHNLDPRCKITGAIVFSAVVAVSYDLMALLLALAVSIILILLARLPVRRVLHRLMVVNGLIVFLWLLLPFTYNGEPLFSIGPLVGSQEGVLLSSQITIKCNTILLTMIGLLATTPIFTLGHAMSQLRIPDKITHLFLFTYRYIHVIFQEYHRLLNAIRIRGFVPHTNMHTYRTYAYLVGMLLVRSYDRAERIHRAMLCRGFTGQYYTLRRFSIGGSDLLYLAAMTAVIFGLGMVQWRGII